MKSHKICLSLSALQIWKTLRAEGRLKTKSLGAWLRPVVLWSSGTKLWIYTTVTFPTLTPTLSPAGWEPFQGWKCWARMSIPGAPPSWSDPSLPDLQITCNVTGAFSRRFGHCLKDHDVTSHGSSTRSPGRVNSDTPFSICSRNIRFYSVFPVWPAQSFPIL